MIEIVAEWMEDSQDFPREREQYTLTTSFGFGADKWLMLKEAA